MAYGYPTYYPQYNPPMQDNLAQLRNQQYLPPQIQQPAPPQQSGIQWVQGIDAAKAYLTAAGTSILLMDSEAQTFYIKSTDQSGMPLPLRIFDYTERFDQPAGKFAKTNPPVDYVTRQEFEDFKKTLGGVTDGEQSPV